VAERLPNSARLRNFTSEALYLLAGPSVPEEAREDAVERAEAGEKIDKAEATRRAMLSRARTGPPARTRPPGRPNPIRLSGGERSRQRARLDPGHLRRMCDRIQARAIRRCGELLVQIPPGKTGPKLQDGADPQFNRTKPQPQPVYPRASARRRCASPRCRRLQFELAVEADRPATVTPLSYRGAE
jgi:hypothetical protein